MSNLWPTPLQPGVTPGCEIYQLGGKNCLNPPKVTDDSTGSSGWSQRGNFLIPEGFVKAAQVSTSGISSTGWLIQTENKHYLCPRWDMLCTHTHCGLQRYIERLNHSQNIWFVYNLNIHLLVFVESYKCYIIESFLLTCFLSPSLSSM